MHIQKLHINNVRNLDTVELKLVSGFNFVEGLNGSGKTSLLEAIYLLTRGRSFRTSKIKNLISSTADECSVFSVFKSTENNSIKVGLRKSRTAKTMLRIEGDNQTSFANISQLVPTIVVAPELGNLIDTSPDSRRKVLDWGLFHMEQSYHDKWKLTTHTIRQRNVLLRQKSRDKNLVSSWNRKLADISLEVTSMRNVYFSNLYPYLVRVFESLGLKEEYLISLYKGWNDPEDYYELLSVNQERDFERGYTSQGPHRADIKIKLEGKLAKDVCSRDQKKMISLAIRLAQIELLHNSIGKNCLLLIDDFAAELDHNNRKYVCDLLHKNNSQVFMTCIDVGAVENYVPKENKKLFHVKQGVLTESDCN